MKWRNSKERELLSSGGTRESTLPTKSEINGDFHENEDPQNPKEIGDKLDSILEADDGTYSHDNDDVMMPRNADAVFSPNESINMDMIGQSHHMTSNDVMHDGTVNYHDATHYSDSDISDDEEIDVS